MSTSKSLKRAFGIFLAMIFFTQASFSQNYSVNSAGSTMKIEGTSNVHDWEITAREFQGSLDVDLNNGKIRNIENLRFSVIAESLKSGKSGMDKNTYKALKTNKNKTITYELNDVKNLNYSSGSTCQITGSGFLTIAGTGKPVEITFDAKISGNNIILTGSKNLKMSDFNIDPPTAMFGTITTGDEVRVNFNIQFSK